MRVAHAQLLSDHQELALRVAVQILARIDEEEQAAFVVELVSRVAHLVGRRTFLETITVEGTPRGTSGSSTSAKNG